MCARTTARQANSILVIQHIWIRWSKKSRGGGFAEKRNRIPHTFSLPLLPEFFDRGDHYYVHEVGYDEHNDFVEPVRESIETRKIQCDFRTINSMVEIKNGTPAVTYEWRDGAPARQILNDDGAYVPLKRTFAVEEGNWIQVEYNGRYSCRDFGIWSYEHEIINVARTQPDNLNIFIDSQPSTILQELAQLW